MILSRWVHIGGVTATMNVHAEEVVTMNCLYRQLMVMASRIDTVADDLQQLKSDVHAIKESNKTTSSSGFRIPCPLNCSADFKKVRELPVADEPLSFIFPTGILPDRSFEQSCQD